MIFDGDHPDLFGLLNGGLSTAEAMAAGDHLDTCEPCRAELAEIAVGHGLLRSSVRALGTDAVRPVMPPLTVSRRAHPRAVWLVAAVAVLGLVLGGFVATALTGESSSPSATRQPAVASASLTQVGSSDVGATGDVEMYSESPGRTRMDIRTADLPAPGPDQFYYAWLLDPETQKMLPLGQMGPDGGSFDLAAGTVSSYSAVDVSLESDDGDPGHSVTSVLQGRYVPEPID